MWYFIAAFFLTCAAVWLVRLVAKRFGVVDRPDGGRKKHRGTVPLLGGVAIFIAFWGIVGSLLWWHPVQGLDLLRSKLLAAFIGSVCLLIIGVVDEIKPYSATIRLILTLGAIAVTVYLGMGLEKITNPWGGFFVLSAVVGNSLVFAWLVGMTYTTKILDGLDGLATGIVMIGALMMYFLTATARFYQPNVGIVALVLAGVCAGFLIFNFSPAKIFLGESGSLLLGFLLAIVAVISGGKVATALLVMAVPILDLARVIYVRLRHHQSPFQGDRRHLHFQLLDRGWSERQVVIGLYAVAAIFGTTTLFLASIQKLVALLVLVIAMVAVGVALEFLPAHQSKP